MPYDPYANPLASAAPRFPSANKAEYFKKAWFENLFYIEKSVKTDPFQIAQDYFPQGFHWIPDDLKKNLSFYLRILVNTGSIFIKPIHCKVDPSRIIFHNCFIISVMTKEEWETHPSTFKTKWWHFFGPITELFPDNLQQAIKHFTISSLPKMKGRETKLPPLLHFCAKYKNPWIYRWQYTKKDDLLLHHYFDKQEFPSPTPKQALITYPTIPGSGDQVSGSESKSSSSKLKKKLSSAKKKDSTASQDLASSSKQKSPFDKLKKKDLLELLKKSIEDNSNSECSDKESKASSADSVASDPYEIFDHDSEDYPLRLGDN
ncbi:hypothetical protein CIPAW_07G040900 [Carya illinoinensis]|uniref:Uncharacterized protein n=1 Tax=Carya illinoinensis TaxID=32201 RepID=A0A8T1Q2G4_CARIL|nr:hypothetical protein CIPAW_07G040900 [Carya illinoinensis]